MPASPIKDPVAFMQAMLEDAAATASDEESSEAEREVIIRRGRLALAAALKIYPEAKSAGEAEVWRIRGIVSDALRELELELAREAE